MLGSESFVLIYQVAGVLAGLVLGVFLSIALNSVLLATGSEAPPSSSGELLTGIGAICGWSLGLSRAQREHRRRFLAAIRERGTPSEMNATFALGEAGLIIDTPRISYRVTTDAILEVIETATAWLIQVDITTVYLPKRAFEDADSERAFLEQLLASLLPEARDRSDKPSAT